MKIYKPITAFIIGSSYLSFFDYLQGKFHIESYDSSILSIIKTILQFGFLAVILDKLTFWFEKNFEYKWQNESTANETLKQLMLFTLLYINTLISNYISFPMIMFGFVAITLVNIFSFFKDGDWKYMITLGLLGSGIESILVHLHIFSYTNPNILGIPLWLPLLWGNGGVFVRRLFNLPWLQWRDD